MNINHYCVNSAIDLDLAPSILLKMSNVLTISKCATTFGNIPNEYDHF